MLRLFNHVNLFFFFSPLLFESVRANLITLSCDRLVQIYYIAFLQSAAWVLFIPRPVHDARPRAARGRRAKSFDTIPCDVRAPKPSCDSTIL